MSTEQRHCNTQHVMLSCTAKTIDAKEKVQVQVTVDSFCEVTSPIYLHTKCLDGAQWATVSWALASYRDRQAIERVPRGEGFR